MLLQVAIIIRHTYHILQIYATVFKKCGIHGPGSNFWRQFDVEVKNVPMTIEDNISSIVRISTVWSRTVTTILSITTYKRAVHSDIAVDVEVEQPSPRHVQHTSLLNALLIIQKPTSKIKQRTDDIKWPYDRP